MSFNASAVVRLLSGAVRAFPFTLNRHSLLRDPAVMKTTCSRDARRAMAPTTVPAALWFGLRCSLRALIPVLFVVFLAVAVGAQNTNGRFIGTVTDPQGAALAGARVALTNSGTNAHWDAVTDSTGSYQVLDVPIGMYSVTVEVAGFHKAVTEGLELTIGQSLRVDVRLKVGAITETVQVESEAAQVETLNPTVGGTVTGAPIQDLPLNGRNVLDLALTQPGVVPAPEAGYGGGQFTVAGGRADAVSYLLDGGTNDSVTGNSVVFNPNPDTIAEFRILSNNYTAEYGRNGGGTVSVVTKSGTNRVHGSLFEYLRNDAFNANDFFDNLNGQPRPVLKRSQLGGTVGGPIVKDRIFFFFGYQGQRQSALLNGNVVTTYTPAELTGDFSQAANGGPNPRVACFLAGYQPTGPLNQCVDATKNPLPSHPFFQSNPTLAANAIIDPTKINPVAQAFISAGLIPTSAGGQLFTRGSSTDNVNEYTGRADFYATVNDRVTVTVGSSTEPTVTPFSATGGDPSVPGFPESTTTTNQFLNIGYTKTISTALLNEFHATAARYFNKSAALSHPPTPSRLGIQINSDLPYAPPIINLFDSGLNLGFNENVPRKKADNTYALSDSLTWTKGRHTMKAGGRFAFLQENSVYSFATNGWFFFYGAATTVGSGSDLADFLLGAPDEYQQYPTGNNNEHQKQMAAFVQDEWRVTPRLTLTLGLRYEYTSPERDIHGHSYSTIPGLQSSRFQNAPLGLVVPGDHGAPRGWYFPDYKDFAPRFGFAWDPFGNGKTSIRGGGGMFFDTLNGWMSDWNNGVLPWWSSADLFFPAGPNAQNMSMSHPYQNACIFDANGNCSSIGQPDPFPSAPPPRNLDFGAAGYLPFGFGDLFVDPHLKTPYVYQYNLTVERQLSSGFMAEVGYLGSSSHKLLTWSDINPIIPGTTNRLINVQEGLTAQNGFAPLPNSFAGLNNANYNAFEASLTKRMGAMQSFGSMFFTLAYTWSHNLDNGSGFNQRTSNIPYFNRHALYSNSDFDMRNRLVFSGGWDLPFANLWANGPKRLTHGWSLYPIFFVQSGIPLDLTAGLGNPQESVPGPSGAGDPQLIRPNQLTGRVQTFDPRHQQTINGLTGNYYFNPNDFALDPCINAGTCPLGFYGTFRRNSFVGPSRANFDLALEKATNLVGDRVNLGFRVEAFNVLNHGEFRNPGSINVSSQTLGLVSRTYDPRILQLALRLTF
jgi:outer membrane receptor protein involved in Fe transport